MEKVIKSIIAACNDIEAEMSALSIEIQTKPISKYIENTETQTILIITEPPFGFDKWAKFPRFKGSGSINMKEEILPYKYFASNLPIKFWVAEANMSKYKDYSDLEAHIQEIIKIIRIKGKLHVIFCLSVLFLAFSNIGRNLFPKM